MTLQKILTTTAVAVFLPVAAQASSVVFDVTQLQAPTVNAGQTEATVVSEGVTLTASTVDGRVRGYTGGGTGGNGLYIGAPVGGPFSGGAPTDAVYTLSFDTAIRSISIGFDWLTNRAPAEVIQEFKVDGVAAIISGFGFAGVTFDAAAQTVTSTAGSGRGTLTYSGDAFSALSFRHTQAADNIGFTLNNIEISSVPIPASLPLALAGLGALGLMRRRAS